jgi:hypothetical protein
MFSTLLPPELVPEKVVYQMTVPSFLTFIAAALVSRTSSSPVNSSRT